MDDLVTKGVGGEPFRMFLVRDEARRGDARRMESASLADVDYAALPEVDALAMVLARQGA